MTTKRKMLKRVILVIIVSLFLFGTVIGIGIINNRDVSKEQSSKTRLNSDLKTESITEEKEEDDNEEKLETENKEEQIEEKPKEEMPQSEANTNETYTTPKNDTNTNNQQTTTPTPPQTTTPPVVEEPSCTPKKFYTVFRADFDSMAECNRVGELYKKEYGYYGYFCDYTTDDCGVMYYMLTMFDGNNNYIAYPDIPKP